MHQSPLDSLTLFRKRLYDEWLPAFCDDPKRNLSVAGFKAASVTTTDFDAANFLRAIDRGLVVDEGGGRYRCPNSKAFEQLFWEGLRSTQPRALTLWNEPVITIGTIARLGLDFGWPVKLLGMQSQDWAFDLAAYESESGSSPRLLAEVKKSVAEIEGLAALMLDYARTDAVAPSSANARSVNAFKKWRALRDARAPLLWLVGPGDYTRLFEVIYEISGEHLHTSFSEAPFEKLQYLTG